jgi:hypothetical protein
MNRLLLCPGVSRRKLRGLMPANLFLLFCAATLGAIFGWSSALPVSAHDSGRSEGHGDCTSNSITDPDYQWRLEGTGGWDTCTGHDARDEISTNGGRDEIRGEAGADRIIGGDEADDLYGGINDDNTVEYVLGHSGGADLCGDASTPGRCEKLRGGNGKDSVQDREGPDDGEPRDFDWACDGPGDDFVNIKDGDVLDTLDCLCDHQNDGAIIDMTIPGDAWDDREFYTPCSV